MMKRVGIGLVALALVLLATHASATDRNAASCTQAAIQAQVDLSSTIGDRVIVPSCAGTSWATVGGINTGTKGIAIIAAGQGVTVILDDLPKGGGAAAHGITGAPSSGRVLEITGFTWKGSNACSNSPCTGGLLQFNGAEGSILYLHHNDLGTAASPLQQLAIATFNCQYGVIRYNTSYTNFRQFAVVNHPQCDGGTDFGDGQWAQAARLGTDKFLFFENNYFEDVNGGVDGPGFADTTSGGRYVVRYNELVNTLGCGGHGTDTSQRNRSMRARECYGNILRTTAGIGGMDHAAHFRGGTGVVWGNFMQRWNSGVKIQIYRTWDSISAGQVWGPCAGYGPYDSNDGVVYQTGTHTGANAATTLTDSSKTWTSGSQWENQGYTIRNVTRGWGTGINANGVNTISYNVEASYTWNTGDTYTILRVAVCVDQPGRGQGVLLSGSTPSPTGWPTQALEPIYVWGNTLSNVGTLVAVESTSENETYLMQANREYYSCANSACSFLTAATLTGYSGTTVTGTVPGYAPYTYPYPVSGGPPPVSPTLSIALASPTPVQANGVASTTISVSIKDTDGAYVTGATVTFSQGSGHSTISPASCITAGPIASCGVNATNLTVEGVTYTVVANGVTLSTAPVVNWTTIATTCGVTSSLNPSTSGQVVTFTGSVTPLVFSPFGAATGTMTFKDGATTLGTATLPSSPTLPTSTLSAGAHSITAEYAGDSHYRACTSDPLTQTVSSTPPTNAGPMIQGGVTIRGGVVIK